MLENCQARDSAPTHNFFYLFIYNFYHHSDNLKIIIIIKCQKLGEESELMSTTRGFIRNQPS